MTKIMLTQPASKVNSLSEKASLNASYILNNETYHHIISSYRIFGMFKFHSLLWYLNDSYLYKRLSYGCNLLKTVFLTHLKIINSMVPFSYCKSCY